MQVRSRVLGSGCAKCFVCYVRGPFDGAVFEVSGDTLVARSSKLGRSLVVREEDKRTFAVQIQCSFQCRKQRQKCLSEASDGSALVGDEVAAASQEKLQLGDLLLTWLELTEVRPHPRLVGDDTSIAGIGFGLSTVGVASPIHAEARDVEDFLIVFP